MNFLVLLLSVVTARRTFPANFPNAGNVVFDGAPWPMLGHNSRVAPSGGAGLNPFGQDVGAQLSSGVDIADVWPLVCDLDSDGDGATNGQELLDPDCTWTVQNGGTLGEGEPTHPGFVDSEAPPSQDVDIKLKIHIAFMTLAWLVFAPVGVLTAVVLKVKVKSVTSVNWFKIHKLCVGTAVYLTFIAYFCIVYIEEEFEFESPHTRLGHIVLILAIIQPLSGFWRIHINKDGSKTTARNLWEYAHQALGRVLIILAAANLYLGYDLSQVGFIAEGTRTAMQVIIIAALILGGIFCLLYVIFRTDERKEPELPTKKEDTPKAEAVAKDDVNKNAQQGKIPETTTEKQPETATKTEKKATESKPQESTTQGETPTTEKKKEEVTTS